MTWIVTGGAGYIGSHVVQAFVDAGIDALVLDDLSTGRREFVPEGVPLVVGSITDPTAVADALSHPDVAGVVHVAGLKYAGVSVGRPLDFYRVNVEGTRALLEQALAADVRSFVFSSSAAVFGTPDTDLVSEDTARSPESPYGETKLIGEWLLADAARAQDLAGADPLRHTSLRYFNVVGSGLPQVYDVSPHNLFPILLDAVTRGRTPVVYGGDYPTPDGTCVRDYIHVLDLADAHVAAALALEEGHSIGPVNVGRGVGSSVREVMDVISDVLGRDVDPEVVGRRAGDPATSFAATGKIEREFGWYAGHDLRDMVESAWSAWQASSL